MLLASPPLAPSRARGRVQWVNVAKGIGIILMVLVFVLAVLLPFPGGQRSER